MASLKLKGQKEVLSNLEKFKERAPAAARIAMLTATEVLRGYIVAKKLSGQVLHVRTDRLRGSITKDVDIEGHDVVGRVGTNVEYARIHELGGSIPAHTVYPVKKKALRFMIDGKEVFAKYANIPEIKMPKRPYIAPSLKELRRKIQRILGQKFWSEVKSG